MLKFTGIQICALLEF